MVARSLAHSEPLNREGKDQRTERDLDVSVSEKQQTDEDEQRR